MSTFNYFAYGSNMLTSRLAGRCKSAVFSTVGTVERHRLEFSKQSIDGSGKATIVADADAQGLVFGAVFQISNSELDDLNAAEGTGYERRRCEVTCVNAGREIEAWTYYAKEQQSGLIPYDWYLALVIAGLNEHDIDREYGLTLRAFDYDIDDVHDRKSRRDAIAAFNEIGIDDYRTLLR